MINEKTTVNTTSFFSDLVDSSHLCHPGLTSQVLGRFTQEAFPMPRKECHQLAMALGAGVAGPSRWFHQGWGKGPETGASSLRHTETVAVIASAPQDTVSSQEHPSHEWLQLQQDRYFWTPWTEARDRVFCALRSLSNMTSCSPQKLPTNP